MAHLPERQDMAGGRAVARPNFLPTSRRPELPGLDTVELHLEMEGLVVHPEESSRLALVPTRGVEDAADRLLLGVSRGGLGDLLQRRADWSQFSAECGRRRRRRQVDGEDREVLGLDDVRREENGPANDVPKLPHIARPVVAR